MTSQDFILNHSLKVFFWFVDLRKITRPNAYKMQIVVTLTSCFNFILLVTHSSDHSVELYLEITHFKPSNQFKIETFLFALDHTDLVSSFSNKLKYRGRISVVLEIHANTI